MEKNHGSWTWAASLEDRTLRPWPNLDNNVCMLKKHYKLETSYFPSRKPPLPKRTSVVIYLQFFVLIIYFRRYHLMWKLYIQETCWTWTSVKHGLWRKEPGCLMLEFIILPTPERVWLFLMSLICMDFPSAPALIVSTQLYWVLGVQCHLSCQKEPSVRRGPGFWSQAYLSSGPTYKLCGLDKNLLCPQLKHESKSAYLVGSW